MPGFQEKITRQRNMKVKLTRQRLSAIVSMLKELKETMSKELKKK